MTRNQNDDDDGDASSWKRVKTCDKGGGASLSDLNHDLLILVMMRVGILDFHSFSRVCKSWRSVALSNRKKFIASKPPMSIRIPSCGCCSLEDFEGRVLKINLPHSDDNNWFGLTCGYLIFFEEEKKDFRLVNPITRHELHFPAFPWVPNRYSFKAILVFSPTINGLVFVVSRRNSFNLWFSISGRGGWNRVPSTLRVLDLHAFKGNIYILNTGYRVSEMRLDPEPILTLLQIKNFPGRYVNSPVFVSSGENLYAMDQVSLDSSMVHELDFDKMKWVSPEERTIGEYAFFLSTWKGGSAIKPEFFGAFETLPSKYKRLDDEYSDDECLLDTISKGVFFGANTWYFPHQCLNVDLIN